MRTFVKIMQSGLLCLALAACAQPTTTADPAASAAAPPPVTSTPEDETSCKAAGGEWKGVGMMNTPACVIPYPDAGKVCSDKSDCTGMCWAESADIEGAGKKATGTCQPTNMPFGCHAEIIKGVQQIGMCAD